MAQRALQITGGRQLAVLLSYDTTHDFASVSDSRGVFHTIPLLSLRFSVILSLQW